jgi:hypothetical protein
MPSVDAASGIQTAFFPRPATDGCLQLSNLDFSFLLKYYMACRGGVSQRAPLQIAARKVLVVKRPIFQ